MAKKLLISGYSGFVGENLLSYLNNFKFDLFGLSRDRKNISSVLKGTYTWSDLSIKSLYEINCIIHLAGKAHDLKKVSQPEEYYQVNYELTKSLYDAFLQSDAKKFIFISSVKAAADKVDETTLTEHVIPHPQTPYGKSKLMAEEYIKSQPLPLEKSYYILRPCMIHGPGNKGNLNLLYKFVAKNLPYPLASFDNKRSFLSIENLCFVIKEIITQDNVPSGIYNIADDMPLSTSELFTIIAQTINKSPRLLSIPKKAIIILAKVGDKLKLPLTTEKLQKLTDNYVVSNKKISETLQITLPLSSRDGIIKTIQSLKI